MVDDTFDEDCWNCGETHSGPCALSDEEEADRLDREEEERTCIGPLCINPHYSHSRSECETEEMARAFYEEMEADYAARAESRGAKEE